VREALEMVPVGYRAKLFESCYLTELEPEFRDELGNTGVGPELPILYGDPYDPLMRVDVELMRPIGNGPREAMKRLVEALEQTRRAVRLQPGEILIVDNRRTVHGRDPFTPSYDGNDRWMVRLLVSLDLAHVEERGQRNKHMITMQFAAATS
jgi:L-asparagine oxygenase